MIGAFMGLTFTVSAQKLLTVSNLEGSAGSEWASHSRVGAKAKAQWIAPKLRRYSLELQLRAQDGVKPRETLEGLQRAAESAAVDHFIIGDRPLSELPFRITELTDSWDTVISGGILTACTVGLTIEEYA